MVARAARPWWWRRCMRCWRWPRRARKARRREHHSRLPRVAPAVMDKTVKRGTRTGFTTGACSAAAARAAVLGLVTGSVPDEIACLLPNGERVRFAVRDGCCDGLSAHAMVVKFAGDDPDCTDGAHLTVDLRLLAGQAETVTFRAGEGVGTVTMPGLGLDVGGPAINPVPRQNIADNLRAAGHPGRHQHPGHHRHRPPLFDCRLARQRGAGHPGGSHAGAPGVVA